MAKSNEYKAIAMWGACMGSHANYIREEQERAAAAGAPLDAIFERYAEDGSGRTGTWATVSGLAEDHTFRIEYERRTK